MADESTKSKTVTLTVGDMEKLIAAGVREALGGRAAETPAERAERLKAAMQDLVVAEVHGAVAFAGVRVAPEIDPKSQRVTPVRAVLPRAVVRAFTPKDSKRQGRLVLLQDKPPADAKAGTVLAA